MKRILLIAAMLAAFAAFANAADVVVAKRGVFLRPLIVRPAVVQTIPLTFESRPAQAFTVVEQPREPFVMRGIFTDRVRIPRGKTLSLETQ